MEPKLTDKDWTEVYYALASKAAQIDRGEFGEPDEELDTKEWSGHLRAIMSKIARVVEV